MKSFVYVSEGKIRDVRDETFAMTLRLLDQNTQPPEEGSAWQVGKYYTYAEFDKFISEARPRGVRISFETQSELEYLVSRIAPFVVSLDVIAKHSRAFDLTPLEKCIELESVQFYWNTKQTTLWDLTKNPHLKIFQMMDYYSVSDFSAMRGSTVEDLRLYGCNGMSSFTSKLHIADLSFILDMPQLKSLSLDIVKDEPTEYYLTLLEKCKSLTSLDMTGSFFTFLQYAWLKAHLPGVKSGLEGVIKSDFSYWVIGKRMPKSLADPNKADEYREKYAALVEEYKTRDLPPSDSEKAKRKTQRPPQKAKAPITSANDKYTVDVSNYTAWQKTHTDAFGEIYSSAFSDNAEAKLHLTAALINISKRDFDNAMPKLLALSAMAVCDFDRAAVSYFLGLNHEMKGNESEMCEHYDRALTADLPTPKTVQLHPYYRTAKLAQRDSECTKAIYYYRRALAFHDGKPLVGDTGRIVAQIAVDVATTYLYMHRYDDSARFIRLSESCDVAKNQTRIFISAILHAATGRREKSLKLAETLEPFLYASCIKTVNAILDGTDLHYCAVPQDRSLHPYFRERIEREAAAIANSEDPGFRISELLTNTFGFMKRKLECRVYKNGGQYTVYCKTYHVKSLAAEYDVLFSAMKNSATPFLFRAVAELESDNYK